MQKSYCAQIESKHCTVEGLKRRKHLGEKGCPKWRKDKTKMKKSAENRQVAPLPVVGLEVKWPLTNSVLFPFGVDLRVHSFLHTVAMYVSVRVFYF